ncbi:MULTISPECIES: hypothetical protein [unclassified Thioalkalivibrio]|uniref:hypothetical protein n=1 Tax=unclassified Thioalkalivibrio TaxID=2621013 RepID=UPI0003640B82|nr:MULTISPECIES: hypothetical protein [unclassified Thioalkalivibrio]
MLALLLTLVGTIGLVWLGRTAARLAHCHRQVTRAWEQFDVLVCQRNALLPQALTELAVPPARRAGLDTVLAAQESARRHGDPPQLATAERDLRKNWDLLVEEFGESNRDHSGVRRIEALDAAITDAIRRYNAALGAYRSLCRTPPGVLVARLTARGSYAPLEPSHQRERAH